MKIWGWPADEGGCAWYRIRIPLGALTDDDIGFGTVMPTSVLDEPDRLVVLQRSTAPKPMMVLDEFVQKGRPWVYDADDLLWALTPDNPAYSHYSNPIIAKRFAWLIEHATLFTTSTANLADEARAAGAHRVAVVPNTLPDELFDFADQVSLRPRPDDRFTIFWRGSPTHSEDVKVLRYAAKKLHARDDVRLVFAGADYRKELGVPDAEHLPWVADPEAHVRRVIELQPDVVLAPLAHTRFNASKCLDARTRVPTGRGILPVAEVSVGDSVWTPDGWRAVEGTLHSEPTVGLRIITEQGREITLTREHRLMVNGEWRQMSTVAVGDTLTLLAGATADVPVVRSPWPATSRKSRVAVDGGADAMDGPSIAINERWARFLGLFAGDGSVQSTCLSIHCDAQDGDLVQMVQDDLDAMGVPARLHSRRGSVQVTACSANFSRAMERLGVIGPHESATPTSPLSRRFSVPEAIWRSGERVIGAWLSGLFEADGHNASCGVAVVTKSASFAAEVQVLLAMLGIQARRVRYDARVSGSPRTYESWRVTIGRDGSEVFAAKVGFLSIRKRAGLAATTSKPHSNAFREMSWTDTVASIEGCWVTPVDIQVDGEQFCAAGFLSHNSHVNALEGALAGAMPVCSNVPAYQGFVTPGVDGFLLPNAPDAWWKILRDLVEDGPDGIPRDAIRTNARRFRTSLMKEQYRDLLGSVL